HEQLKPFACEHGNCTLKFARKHDLIRHTKVHTNERKFQCGGCSKKFRRKDHLTIHIKGARCPSMKSL
ncbi:hypothetical protein BC833DRAFT_523623, partial [Globomyces pollinis-pini]